MKIIHLLHIAYFCASSAKKVEVEEAIQPKPLQEPKKVEAEEEIQLKPLHEEQKKIQRKEKRMNFRPNHGSNLARIKSKSIRRKSKAATEWRYAFRYDCHHSSQGNTHTADTVHFRFKDVNGDTITSRTKTISSSKCTGASGYQAVDISTTSQLDFAYVELQIYGGDAFLIDRAIINTYDNSDPGGIGAKWHGRGSEGFGIQNAGYWCLSTDRPDYGYKCGHMLQFYFQDVGSRKAGSVWRTYYT